MLWMLVGIARHRFLSLRDRQGAYSALNYRPVTGYGSIVNRRARPSRRIQYAEWADLSEDEDQEIVTDGASYAVLVAQEESGLFEPYRLDQKHQHILFIQLILLVALVLFDGTTLYNTLIYAKRPLGSGHTVRIVRSSIGLCIWASIHQI
jgi:hypothetical protein